MGELCNSEEVVTADDAILENPNLKKNREFSSSTKTCITKTKPSPTYHTNEKHMTCSSSPTKNNFCLDDEISFESAVNDFNSVAKDVQRICTSDLSERDQNNFTTDLHDPSCIFHEVEIEKNTQSHELHGKGQETYISGVKYIDSVSSSGSSYNGEETEQISNEKLDTRSEEVCSLQPFEGNYLSV